MTTEQDPVTIYLTRVDALLDADERLNPLAAGIIAAAELGVASDSTAFCRALDVSHALVLREIELLDSLRLIRITKRNSRTNRTFYILPSGEMM